MNIIRLTSVFLVVLILPCAGVIADSVVRYQAIENASLTITGNTLGLGKALNANGPGTQGGIGTFTSTNNSFVDNVPGASPAWWAGTTSSWSQNSSAAYLDIPSESEILYAELIWGGSYNYLTEDVSGSLNTAITLSFEDGSTISISPAVATARTTDPGMISSAGFYIHYYIRSSEVTTFISDNGTGRYTVAGVPGTQDENVNSLNAAGWTMVVAYKNMAEPVRKVAIRVGLDWIDDAAPADYSFDGFETVATGEVRGSAFLSAIEGDANLVGDQMSIVNVTAITLFSPNNPANNFFASQINSGTGYLDVRGTFGNYNHDAVLGANTSGGRQGWDLTGVELSSTLSHLGNSQESTIIRATCASSSADSYALILAGFQVELSAPLFLISSSDYTVSDVLSNIGDTVQFSVLLNNTTGVKDAVDCLYTHPLPAGCRVSDFYIDGVSGDRYGTAVTTSILNSGVEIGDVTVGDSIALLYTIIIDAVPTPAVFSPRPSWEYDFSVGTQTATMENGFDAIELEVNIPPSIPVLVSPSHEADVSRPVAIKWKKSNDANNDAISYNLFISTDQDFPGSVPVVVGGTSGGTVVVLFFGIGLALFVTRPLFNRRSNSVIWLLLCGFLLCAVLFACPAPGEKDSEGLELAADESGFLATDLLAGTTYYWKVEAIDSRGGVSESVVRSFTTE